MPGFASEVVVRCHHNKQFVSILTVCNVMEVSHGFESTPLS